MKIVKKTPFGQTDVVHCKMCLGTGRVEVNEKIEGECPLCGGKGRLLKMVEGVVVLAQLNSIEN